MRSRAALLALILSLCGTRGALAQPKHVQAQAEEAFRRGREEQAKGDCKRALELFHRSQDLVPGRGKLLNIAICEEQIGLVATAMHHFQDLALRFYDDPERNTIVKAHIAALTPRLPSLRIAGDRATGATVTCDGVPVPPGAPGEVISLDPGKHEIIVTAAGRPAQRYEVNAEEGKTSVITLPPAAAENASRAQTAKRLSEVPRNRRNPMPGVMVGAASLTLIGVSAGLFAAAQLKRTAMLDLATAIGSQHGRCVGTPMDPRCPATDHLARQADTLHNTAIGFFIGAGVLGVGALTYLLLPPPQVHKTVIGGAGAQVTPALSSEGGGLVLSGAF